MRFPWSIKVNQVTRSSGHVAEVKSSKNNQGSSFSHKTNTARYVQDVILGVLVDSELYSKPKNKIRGQVAFAISVLLL